MAIIRHPFGAEDTPPSRGRLSSGTRNTPAPFPNNPSPTDRYRAPLRMAGLLSLLALGFVIALGAAVWVVYRRLRRPPRKTYATAVARGRPGDPTECDPPREFRAFSFRAPIDRSRHAELPAWEIEGGDRQGPVAVCTPGWGDSKIGALVRVNALSPVVSRIVAWDPSGAGEAPGCSNLGTGADVGALGALLETLAPSLAGRPVLLYGWSLGAGVSIACAAEQGERPEGPPISGVIAEAPYRLAWTPAMHVLDLAGLPWRLNLPIAYGLLGLRLGVGVAWKGFDRVLYAQRLRCPILVVHGTEDDICPSRDGRSIAAAAGEGLFIDIDGAGHNNMWTEEPYRTQAEGAVRDFVRALSSA